jgi:predicted dehydrogenase
VSQHEHLRVGVIGCGAGLFHLEGYAEEPRAKVVALAGLDADRCQSLARRFEIPRVFRDYQDLLAEDDIDAVSIAVPNSLHAPVAIAALEAGKHVLIEKPLARHTDEAERMVAAAKATGKILAVAFQRRTRHDVMLLRDEIAAGKLGNIYYAKAFWMRRQGIPGWGSWFTSKELAGGGPLIDLGVHVLDMALYVMGNPKVTAVSANTYAELGPHGKGDWPNPNGRFQPQPHIGFEVEDLATAFLRLDTGATLLLETSWASFTEVNDAFGIQMYGSQGGGRIFSEGYADTETLTMFNDFGGTTTDSKPRLVSRKGHANIINGFVDGILEGKPVSPDGEEGLDRVRLIDAIYKSAECGKEITL